MTTMRNKAEFFTTLLVLKNVHFSPFEILTALFFMYI